jgi:hypothetical protein
METLGKILMRLLTDTWEECTKNKTFNEKFIWIKNNWNSEKQEFRASLRV